MDLKCLGCFLIVLLCAAWFSVTVVRLSRGRADGDEELLELSSCGDEWPCQNCVKWGLPTCWIHRDANRTASASWRAVICDESFPVLYLPSQLQNLAEDKHKQERLVCLTLGLCIGKSDDSNIF